MEEPGKGEFTASACPAENVDGPGHNIGVILIACLYFQIVQACTEMGLLDIGKLTYFPKDFPGLIICQFL